MQGMYTTYYGPHGMEFLRVTYGQMEPPLSELLPHGNCFAGLKVQSKAPILPLKRQIQVDLACRCLLLESTRYVQRERSHNELCWLLRMVTISLSLSVCLVRLSGPCVCRCSVPCADYRGPKCSSWQAELLRVGRECQARPLRWL